MNWIQIVALYKLKYEPKLYLFCKFFHIKLVKADCMMVWKILLCFQFQALWEQTITINGGNRRLLRGTDPPGASTESSVSWDTFSRSPQAELLPSERSCGVTWTRLLPLSSSFSQLPTSARLSYFEFQTGPQSLHFLSPLCAWFLLFLQVVPKPSLLDSYSFQIQADCCSAAGSCQYGHQRFKYPLPWVPLPVILQRIPPLKG